jgi:hypothetical protein
MGLTSHVSSITMPWCQARNQSCKNVRMLGKPSRKQNAADLPGELYRWFELAGDCAGLNDAKLPYRR